MTNKKQLQKEIKDEGYESDNSSRNNRNNKNSLNKSEKKKIKQLEQERNFEAQKAQNYLEQITKLTAELDGANLEIKELNKIKPTKTQSELELALQEANSKIREQKQTIQELETEKEEIISQAEQTRNEQAEIIIKLEEQIKSTVDNLLLEQLQEQNREYKEKTSKLQDQNKQLIEKYAKLENQTKSTEKTTKEIKEPINKSFFCDGCQLAKQGTYIKRKIDSPFELRLHGRTCYLCSSCSPYYKELNDTTFDKENNPYKLY